MDGPLDTKYDKRDGVEVTRNAKGEYGWKIKLYFDVDIGYAETLEQLSIIDMGLRGRFLPL